MMVVKWHAHRETHQSSYPQKTPAQIAVGLNLSAVVGPIIYKNIINKYNILIYTITINSLYK